jgi:hypothetical protein
LEKGYKKTPQLADEILSLRTVTPLTQLIDRLLFHPSFPVDVRHNAKIFREKLAIWATDQE